MRILKMLYKQFLHQFIGHDFYYYDRVFFKGETIQIDRCHCGKLRRETIMWDGDIQR